jgi:hypothetical protein
MRTCGIDVGQEFVYPVVLDLAKRRLSKPPGPLRPADALEWVQSRKPLSIAIDSPSQPNRGLLADASYRDLHGIDLQARGADRRVCEWRLSIGGYYSTRARLWLCQEWMRTGMALFSKFAQRGYRIDRAAGGEVFEIHPTYGFRSLVGVTTSGLRVRCGWLAPKRRPGSLGHQQRLALLALLLERWHVPLDECARTSLDWTDAIIGAVLGVLRYEGATSQIDAPGAEEGAIVLAAQSPADVRRAQRRVAAALSRGERRF